MPFMAQAYVSTITSQSYISQLLVREKREDEMMAKEKRDMI